MRKMDDEVKPKPKTNTKDIGASTSDPVEDYIDSAPEMEKDQFQTWEDVVSDTEEEIEKEIPDTLAQTVHDTVISIHEILSEATKFPGWKLSESESNAWMRFSQNVAPHIPLKYIGLVLSGLVIGFIEAMKTMRYIKYRREMKNAD